MVVAVQQPLVECTAIITLCIVEHRPPPCAVTIQKPSTDERWNDPETVPASSNTTSQCPGDTPNAFNLAYRPRVYQNNYKAVVMHTDTRYLLWM